VGQVRGLGLGQGRGFQGQAERSGVNFIHILRAAFTPPDPESP